MWYLCLLDYKIKILNFSSQHQKILNMHSNVLLFNSYIKYCTNIATKRIRMVIEIIMMYIA